MSFEMNSYNVLNNFDFKPDRTEDLCVITKNGRKYLDTIDKKEAHSLVNQFLKIFGAGPLANKDTSITGVEEYLVELFQSPEDNDLKKMKLDSLAYKTTVKIAELAGKKGFHALENVMLVQKIYPKLTPEQQQKTSFEDFMLVVRGGGGFETVKDLQKFVGLLKTGKKLEGEIHKLKTELAEVLPENAQLKKQIKQAISDFTRLQETNNQKIFVERYGSKAAKKLPFEDLQLLFNNRHSKDISHGKEKDLKQLVDSLRAKEGLQRANEAVEEPVDVFVESNQEELNALFENYGVSEDVRQNLTKEDLELLINYGFESKINPEATSEDLKMLVELLDDLENTNLFLEELSSEQNDVVENEEIESLKIFKEDLLERIEWARYDVSDEVKENMSLEDIRYLVEEGFENSIDREATSDHLKQIVNTLKENDKQYARFTQSKSNLDKINEFIGLSNVPNDIMQQASQEDLQLFLDYGFTTEISTMTLTDFNDVVFFLNEKEDLFQDYDVSKDVKFNLSSEDLQLLIAYGFEKRLNETATTENLKKLIGKLSLLENTEELLEEGKNAQFVDEDLAELHQDLLNELELERLK